MLLSMTGFGESQAENDDASISVEIRTVNSRYFKISIRSGEAYSSLDPQIEAIVRKRIRRATVMLTVRVERARPTEDYQINREVLDSYRRQLADACREWELTPAPFSENLLLLPGVVSESSEIHSMTASDWPLVREVLNAALDNLDQMRAKEGRSMAADLLTNCRATTACLKHVERRAPLVVEAYRDRLTEKIQKILGEFETEVDPSALIKEVSLFAERSDISEEIVRLQSHLEQFESIMNSENCSGRKLDFLTQEMVRESNTIGSKANDVEIARHVVEIKAAIERIREMIQNIE